MAGVLLTGLGLLDPSSRDNGWADLSLTPYMGSRVPLASGENGAKFARFGFSFAHTFPSTNTPERDPIFHFFWLSEVTTGTN